jgi:hypothetical protein
MPIDLYQKFGQVPVDSQPAEEPKDLFAGREDVELPTVSSLADKYATDDYGFSDDEKVMIGQLFTEDELKEIEKQEPMGFLEALRGKGWGHMLPYVGTGEDIGQGAADLEMVMKAKDGDESAQRYVKEMVKKDLAAEMRGTTIMGKMGNILHYAPGFIGEMFVAAWTLGAGATPKVAQAGTQTALKVGTKEVAKQFLKKAGKGALTATAMSAAMPQMTAKNYLDRRVAGSIEITDKGELMLKDAEEMPATTAMKAFGDTWVEVASEMSGEAIMAGAGKALTPVKKLASPMAAKLNKAVPVKVKDTFMREFLKFKPDGKISKLLSDKVYFNGVLGEMGEERVGDIMRVALGLDDSEKPTADKYIDAIFPDKEQLYAEAGAFTMIGVGSHAAVRAYNGLVARGFSDAQARQTLDGMTETQKEAMADKIGIGQQTVIKTEEIPLDKIKLSKDIPNFKEGSNENGVVAGEQLQGKYDRLGTAPIVLWERNNGDLEVITGRHRLDLARRNGEATIPSQIIKESEGFTAEQAHLFDVEQNIKDGKGTVKDYVRFFKESDLGEDEIKERGLTARSLGKMSYDIAKNGSDSLTALFLDGKIPDAKAAAIASGAPANEAAQAAGVKMAKKMSADELKAYVSILNTKQAVKQDGADLFGFDDSNIKEAEAIAKLVAKDKAAIDAKISAVKGALRNPQAAQEMGLKFEATPENIGKEVDKLNFEKESLDKFYTNPELMAYYRSKIYDEKMAADKKIYEEKSLYDVLPAYTPQNVEKLDAIKNIPSDMQQVAEQSNKQAHPFWDRKEPKWQTFKRNWTDYLEPLRELSESVYKDARLYAGVGGKIAIALSDYTEDMNGNKTGEGLIPILNDFKKEFGVNQKTLEEDLGSLLIAQRYADLARRGDVQISAEQFKSITAIYEDLRAKYGDSLERFKHYMERIYDYQKRISHLLVESGLMGQKSYDAMLEKNPHYVPFYRVLEQEKIPQPEAVMKNAKGKGLLKAKPTVKRIKGSDLDIRNPFASIVNNTASIITNAHKNAIVQSVAKLRKSHPDLVKIVDTPKASYDKGLRDMLKKGIEELGGTYERTSKRLSKDNAFGVYLPAENKIKEKIGTDAALAHEFGHMLDHKLGLGKYMFQNEKIEMELMDLADERLGGILTEEDGRFKRILNEAPERYKNYLYSRPELIANLYDAYINAPELLKQHAPNAKALLDKFIDESSYKWLKDIHRTLDVGFEEFTNQMESDKGVVGYYEHGVKKYIRVHQDMYDALKGVDMVKLPATIRLFTTFPASLLRWGATQANITFALIRNPLRDTTTAAMQTRVGFIPVVDTLRGAGNVLLNTETYKDWKRNGGSFDSFMQINENSKLNPYKELFEGGFKFKYLNPFFYVEKVGGLFEEGTRVGVYEKAIKKGMDQKEAAFMSRDSTIDFARGGKIAKNINQFVPFFNANIQGLVSMTEKFKKNPVGMSIKALAELTIPSMALSYYYTMLAPDDDKEEYAEIPTWQKNLFWNIKFNGHWVTIPKPFAYGAVFATLPQAMVEGITTDKDIDWINQAKNIYDNLNVVGDISGVFPPVFKLGLELQQNRNFYTGRDIVPSYLVDVAPEEQFTDRTSELAKEFGKLGLSPIKVEHTITTLGAGLMKDFLNLSDMVRNEVKEDKPAREAGEMPIIRGFIAREPTGYNSNSVQEFMDKYAELEKISRTLKKKEKEESDDAESYAEKHERELDLFEEMKSYRKELKNLNTEINDISKDDTLSPQEKRKELRDLRKEMTSTAKEALEAIKEY